MRELAQFLVQQLVNQANAVKVKETRGDTASVLELRVGQRRLGARDRQAGPHRAVDSHHSYGRRRAR